MIQEGVHTSSLVDGSSAEPVIYMVDKFVAGGFYRVTAGRADDENLNVPGSRFVTFGSDKSYKFPEQRDRQPAADKFDAYDVIARVALVATSIEIQRAGEAFETHNGRASGLSAHDSSQ
jgi:glutamate--cysteine ligase